MREERVNKFPEAFLERMKSELGEVFSDFETSLSGESPVSVRVNPQKWRAGLPADQVPWCSTGFYLPERPLFTADPWLHGGAYYVQEPSSMFIGELCKAVWPATPALVLDLCGAPGGKATHLMSLLRHGDLLVTNEVIRSRARILQENVSKWGSPGVVVANGDPSLFSRLGEIFDLIVVDAPCSGEGLFRKDNRSAAEWSPANVRLCAARQRRILAEAWKCLKPGGAVVYSTCTFNQDENEENMEWLAEEAGALFLDVNPDPSWPIVTSRRGKITGYRFYPHLVRGEGFFAAVARKEGIPTSSLPSRNSLKKWTPSDKSVARLLENWVKPGTSGIFLSNGEFHSFFPGEGVPLLSLLEREIPLLQVGIPVALPAGSNMIPHPFSAFSRIFRDDAFPVANLSLEEALRFLKRENLALPGREKGWILTAFRDLPLGWVKNLGNRTNNYFPQEFRIRMTFDSIPAPWHRELW